MKQNIFSLLGSTSNYKALGLVSKCAYFVKNVVKNEIYGIGSSYNEKLPIIYANIRV